MAMAKTTAKAVKIKTRRIVSVTPPLPARDYKSLEEIMTRVNAGRTFFLGTRFVHRGSVVVITPREKQ